MGDRSTFEVKTDGSVLLDGKPYWRVFGYTQNDVQRNRFMAAIVIFPFLHTGITVALPREVKNADRDPAIRRQPRISIPSENSIYVGDERIPEADVDSQLGEKIAESLQGQPEANRIVNIASSISLNWKAIVLVLRMAREQRVDRIGLIVAGDNGYYRFLLQIQPLRDPNEDLSRLKLNPLFLGVSLRPLLEVKLTTGGYEFMVLEVKSNEPRSPYNTASPTIKVFIRRKWER